MSREQKVQAFFEKTEIYLNYDYNLRIRKETVEHYLKDWKNARILDMPCGNGAITAQMAEEAKEIVMVDFAKNMVEIARSKVDKAYHSKVKFINDDFYNLSFEKESFDVVICLGILAHIKDVDRFMNDVADLVKPGGHLIIQNTDVAHPYTWLIHFYLWVRRTLGKDKYKLNRVKGKEVITKMSRKGFFLNDDFRYNQSFVGFSKLFSNKGKYNITRNIFGEAGNNKNAILGGDHIYHFIKKEH